MERDSAIAKLHWGDDEMALLFKKDKIKFESLVFETNSEIKLEPDMKFAAMCEGVIPKELVTEDKAKSNKDGGE
jgi:hypothetical protein